MTTELAQVISFRRLLQDRASTRLERFPGGSTLLGAAGHAHRSIPIEDERTGLRLAPDFVAMGWVAPRLACGLKEQTDGSYGAFCRYEVGSYVARLSWSRFDGLAFDVVGPGDPPFTFNDETLARIMELNAYLQIGGVSLWGDAERARLVFRRAIPLLWLSCARDEGVTLLSYDFIKSTLDNASGAWEDIERIWRGGPILRP